MRHFRSVQTIRADQALTREGWREDVRITIGDDGRIAAVETGMASGRHEPDGIRVGILLPSPVNLHSHSFQRAMSGLSERRGPSGRDSFWTWRETMYRFVDVLTPDDAQAIAAFVQMEMLEAGYAGVAEFHYLHHQPDGAPYADIAEMSARIASAAAATGIGLTLLPVLYEQGGCDGRPLGAGQRRFGNDPERFGRLFEKAGKALAGLPRDARIGVAPHSLRAVSREGLAFAAALAPNAPIHIHAAEQVGEVEEVETGLGARPVSYLLDNLGVDGRWCLIHCTQMERRETEGLARTGAVAGLCPITESSLGDGIFDGRAWLDASGRFGVGSDSNIRISLAEELRTLEYSQRLRDRARAVLADERRSTGRVLFEEAVKGGAQAAGREAGAIAPGMLADLVALDGECIDLVGKQGDTVLDTFLFAGDSAMVSEVWSAGRHVVRRGRHVEHETIVEAYRKTMSGLGERL